MKKICLPILSSGFKRNQCCLLTLIALYALTSTSHAAATLTFSNIWNIPVGSRPYMTVGNTERGVAINPITGHVLIASRGPSTENHIYIVDGETGADIGELDTTGIGGGTLTLVHVGVADDGAIYAANLQAVSALAGMQIRIYRWADETPLVPPTLAFGPGLDTTTVRYGDSLDVRGAGTDTQIIMSGNVNSKVALFTTTDGVSFTATELAIGAGMTAGDFGKGLAFGTNNTIYGKNSTSVNIRHASFDAVAGTLSLIETITADSLGVAVSVDTTNNALAVVVSDNNATQTSHRLKVYDISNPASPSLISDVLFPIPTAANANRIGAADFGLDKLVGLDPNNGVIALKKVFVTNLPPSITSQPIDQAAQQGGYVTFSVTATGSQPLRYHWRLNETTLIPNATNSSLTVSNLQSSDAGAYSVVVTNLGGMDTSSNAVLTILPSALSSAMVKAWCLSPGERPYLSSDNTQRGMAYNATTDHLLLVSRTPSLAVRVLNAANGADLHALDLTGVSGGFTGFPLNMIGVADDGVVYACNLFNGGTGPDQLKIYRWDDEGAVNLPTVAYGPADPGVGRLGDTFDVRGSGTGTQILMGSHETGTQLVIFTTTDGVNFTPTVVNTDAPANFARLGVAFGSGDTVWTKNAAHPLRHISFDLGSGSGTVLQTFTSVAGGVTAIGVDVANDVLAGIICVGEGSTPDNLQLYDIINLSSEPVLLDQDFFPTDNVNLNGTGAVDFGGGRVYALDSNNGLCAFNYIGRLKYSVAGNNLTLTWTDPSSVLQCSTNVTGPYANVPGATSPYMTSTVGPPPQKFFILKR